MANRGYAERLELVRTRLGFETLQEFVDALNRRRAALGDEPFKFEPFNYVTVRRYHRDRRPTPDYLVGVSNAFGVRIEWLSTGEEPMMEAEVATSEGEGRVSRYRHIVPDLNNLPHACALALLDHVDRAILFYFGPIQPGPHMEEDQAAYAAELWDELKKPFEGRDIIDWQEFGDYVTAYLMARNAALRVSTTARKED